MKSSVPGYDLATKESAKSKHKDLPWITSRDTLWTIYLVAIVLSDVLMTLLAFRLAYFARFDATLPIFRLEVVPSQPFYSTLTVILVSIWLIIFAVVGLYQRQNLLGGTDEYSLVTRATTIGLMILIMAGFLDPAFIIARGWVLLVWMFSCLFVILGRLILRRIVYLLRRRGHFLSTAVIVGANDEGLSLARQLLNWPTSGIDVIGFVDKKLKPGTNLLGNISVLGKVDQLDDIIQKNGVEELILASSAISSRDKMLEIFQRYGINSGVNVRMSSGLYEIITTGLTVKEFAYVPLVGVNKVRLTGWDTFLKFTLDFCLTIPGMILLSPILLLIALAVKLDSPGPVFHRRRVMGVNNKKFDALKFRTMHINGDEILDAHPELKEELAKNHKLKDDPRVTRVGRWLRKYSLDELPQLLNILKMDMSLVGPRIISPVEMENYDQWGLNLLTVKPGLTGLWQVSGRSDVSYVERVQLDMHYIRNWSMWLDLLILWRTIPVVLKGEGAY
jgi:exopolysaccharide biosynthesis polyprenyl glycosylphosphotransferase